MLDVVAPELADDQEREQRGRTDLADGMVLCAFHHHRAHDRDYDAQRQSDGRVRFHRRS